VIDDAAGLAWVVNLGCIELHPHPVRTADLDQPDELRADPDPCVGISWAEVRTVAFEVKAFLEEMGLRGWPKTSGSRGMHINVGIEPRWPFHEVRRATLALARAIERRLPERATSNGGRKNAEASLSITIKMPGSALPVRLIRSGRCPMRECPRRFLGMKFLIANPAILPLLRFQSVSPSSVTPTQASMLPRVRWKNCSNLLPETKLLAFLMLHGHLISARRQAKGPGSPLLGPNRLSKAPPQNAANRGRYLRVQASSPRPAWPSGRPGTPKLLPCL
jgi:hypothetical protein